MALSVLCKSLVGTRIPDEILDSNWVHDENLDNVHTCVYYWYKIYRYTIDGYPLCYKIEARSGYNYDGVFINVHFYTDVQNRILKIHYFASEFSIFANTFNLKLREKRQLELLINNVLKLDGDPRISTLIGRKVKEYSNPNDWVINLDKSKSLIAENYEHTIYEADYFKDEITHILKTNSITRDAIGIVVLISTNLDGLVKRIDIQSFNPENFAINMGLNEEEIQQGIGAIEKVLY